VTAWRAGFTYQATAWYADLTHLLFLLLSAGVRPRALRMRARLLHLWSETG